MVLDQVQERETAHVLATKIAAVSCERAEPRAVAEENITTCKCDNYVAEGCSTDIITIESLEKEEEEELSSITYCEDDVYTNLLQFLEESSTPMPSCNMITGEEEETAAPDLKQKQKPAPQDVIIDSVSLFSTISTQIENNFIEAVDAETTTRNKTWIWDELDSAFFNSQNVHQCHMPPTGTLQSAAAVEEKERSFQSLVSKIKALREKLSEKEREVVSLEMSLENRKSSYASRMLKQQTHWNEMLSKQEVEHEQRFKRQQVLMEQFKLDCTDITTKIESLKRLHESIVSPRESQHRLYILKTEFEKEQQDWRRVEQLRLAKFVDSKVEHIKSSVAKSMEPELTKLLNQNKKALQQLKKQIDHDADELKMKLEMEFAESFKNEHRTFFENILLNDADIRKLECDQQKCIMELSLQHIADLQAERSNLKQEMEQERIFFEEQCKALRRINVSIESNEEEEEKKMFNSALFDHRTDLERFLSDQKRAVQSKRDEIDLQGAGWRKSRENDLQRQYSRKMNVATEELQSKSLKEIALIESRLESEKIGNQMIARKVREEEMHRLVSDHQSQLSEVTKDTQEALENAKYLSELAGVYKSEITELENHIVLGAIALQEVNAEAETLKERIYCACNDSSSIDRLRCELSLQEECIQKDLLCLNTKLEQALSQFNSAIDAHTKQIEQLGCKHIKEINVIQDKVQALLQMKNFELEAKREELSKLKEEYVLKDQELDALRQKYVNSGG